MSKRKYIELIIMRHGQSTADVKKPKPYEGSVDNPLTEKGLEQAGLAGSWIAKHYSPDRIISSTLKRAQKTAQIVGKTCELKIETDKRLQERKNGELGGLTKAEARKKGFLPLSKYKPDETVPGGETLIELRARAETFWSELLSQSKPGQRILIISHGQMIAMLFRIFLGLPTEDSIRLKTGDTGIHCWRIDEKERKIIFCNSCVHLTI